MASNSERGFTLVELMIASLVMMVVMGITFSTFDNALDLNDTVTQLADSTQNLRAGTNLLVRDLTQAGRDIPIGGISIPSEGGNPVSRPGPPDTSYFFTTVGPTLKAITTGAGMGPTINGKPTDVVTIVMADPYLPELELYQHDAATTLPRVASDGSSINVGDETEWLTGNGDEGIPPVSKGDLMFFSSTGSGTTLQTVTSVEDGVINFATGEDDPFNLNQRSATAGSITQILPDVEASPCDPSCEPSMSVRRIYMYTYFVHEETSGQPRLMRAVNFHDATALAGVIEDLELRYDLVDGASATNPTDIADLPFTSNDVTYSASQIRKVNVHVGVRSETVSMRTKDYLRNHLSTVISIRNLAYVSRYDTGDGEDEE